MKVLHVTPSYYPAFVYGGPIRSTHQLNLALAQQGVTVRVLTTDANGAGVLAESGKTVDHAPGLSAQYAPRTFRPDLSIRLLWRLPGAIRWADVVHLTAVYSFTTLPTLFWCKVFGRPLFWSPRGALQDWHGSPKRTLKALWDFACRVVAPRNTTIVAASGLELAAAREKFPQVKAVQIENGIHVPREIQHTSGDRVRVLFLGRIHPIKALENLLEACASIKEVDLELSVAGSGDPKYLASLQELAHKLGVGERVHFLGAVSDQDKARLFSRSDMLVLPSHSENFGMVVAEALAHEVPVIASKGTPWSELQNQGCGLWCENDARSLAAAVVKMATSDRQELGRKGRAWMLDSFNWETQAAKLRDHYGKAQSGDDD